MEPTAAPLTATHSVQQCRLDEARGLYAGVALLNEFEPLSEADGKFPRWKTFLQSLVLTSEPQMIARSKPRRMQNLLHCPNTELQATRARKLCLKMPSGRN
jgi:hypothetical protein